MYEIDIQSQRLAENILNRVSILLSNRIQSFSHCAMDFRTVRLFWLSLWDPVDLQKEVVGLCTPNTAGYLKCSNIKDWALENMMPIHQQIWSPECSVIETVASLLLRVTKHCLAGIRSHCPDKVDDIHAVRKSSTDQCNSSGPRLFSPDQFKDISFFYFKKLRRLPSAFSESGSRIAALVKCHFLINWF